LGKGPFQEIMSKYDEFLQESFGKRFRGLVFSMS